MHGLLARVFPEFAVHVQDLSARWVLSLLDKYPTPEKMARAKPQSLLQIPYFPADKAPLLQAAAATSLASHQGSIAEQLVRQKVRAIRAEKAESADLKKLLEQAWEALPEGPYRRVRTIPGIGLQTAAALVAKIVDIDRFPTASSLVGYFGVFPEEVHVSGTDRRGHPKQGTEMHMSRKGNDLVRRLLYTAAQCAVIWNPPVKAQFARLRAEGKDYNVTLGHCMAKLLRQAFAVWKKDVDFDPEFENRPPAEAALDPGEKQEVAGHKEAVEPPGKVVTATVPSVPSSATKLNLPPLDFAKLRERVSLLQVLETITWHPKSTRGSQWRGACPLHRGACPLHEKPGIASRYFAVHTEKNIYCCHHCGSQGNVLDFWKAWRGKPLLEAGWDLVETLGLDAPLL